MAGLSEQRHSDRIRCVAFTFCPSLTALNTKSILIRMIILALIIVMIVQHHMMGIPIQFPENQCRTVLVHQMGVLRADLSLNKCWTSARVTRYRDNGTTSHRDRNRPRGSRRTKSQEKVEFGARTAKLR
jgi:hypothetical protein